MKAKAKHAGSMWRGCLHPYSFIRAMDEHVMFKEQYMCTQLCALNIFSHLYVLQNFNMAVPWSDEMHAPNTQCYNTCKIYVHFLFEANEKKNQQLKCFFFSPILCSAVVCVFFRWVKILLLLRRRRLCLLAQCRCWQQSYSALRSTGKCYRTFLLHACYFIITVIILLNFFLPY